MTSKPSGIEHIDGRLRMVRKELGLTQVQVATRAGAIQDIIQKIENGHSLRPRFLMEISDALDVNPAWLQSGEPYAKKEWPAEVPRKTSFTNSPSFVEWVRPADLAYRFIHLGAGG
jgi:transcriptional regulator with XRE-family HTH domain